MLHKKKVNSDTLPPIAKTASDLQDIIINVVTGSYTQKTAIRSFKINDRELRGTAEGINEYELVNTYDDNIMIRI